MAMDMHIGLMQRADTPAVVRVHAEAFPEYFLTHLGDDFLKLFYAEFVNNPIHPGYVARLDDQVVGFVVGTSQPRNLYGKFYRRNFGRLVGIVAKRVVSDGYVRRHISTRMQHLLIATKAFFHGDAPSVEAADDMSEQNCAHLLSIGVIPEVRGRGIAEKLMSQFEQHTAQEGMQKVLLSVRNDNPRAIAFYKKCGWVVEQTSESSIIFGKRLDSLATRVELALL